MLVLVFMRLLLFRLKDMFRITVLPLHMHITLRERNFNPLLPEGAVNHLDQIMGLQPALGRFLNPDQQLQQNT